MERQRRPRSVANAIGPENEKSDYQQYELSGKEFNVPSGKHYEDIIRAHMKKLKKENVTDRDEKK